MENNPVTATARQTVASAPNRSLSAIAEKNARMFAPALLIECGEIPAIQLELLQKVFHFGTGRLVLEVPPFLTGCVVPDSTPMPA